MVMIHGIFRSSAAPFASANYRLFLKNETVSNLNKALQHCGTAYRASLQSFRSQDT